MKDAYYFSHDSNAKDDPKCVMLIEQLGLEGYGIYWILVETLRDQANYRYPISLLPALARRFNTSTEKVKATVANYGLFTIDEEEFFSESLNRRMGIMDAKREQARYAGLKSAEKRKQLMSNSSPTTVQPTYNDRSTIKVKESKEKESKLNKIKLNKLTLTEFFTEVIHKPSSTELETLNELVNDYGTDALAEAIDTADKDNIRNMSYIITTLKK